MEKVCTCFWYEGSNIGCELHGYPIIEFKSPPLVFDEHPGPSRVQMMVPNRWVTLEQVEQEYPSKPPADDDV